MAKTPAKRTAAKGSVKTMKKKWDIKDTGGEASGSGIKMGKFGRGKLMDRGTQK